MNCSGSKGRVLSLCARLGYLLVAACTGTLLWSVAAQAAIPASERQVLIDLYNGTNGAICTVNDGWTGPGTECSWYGITCDDAQAYCDDPVETSRMFAQDSTGRAEQPWT